MSGASPAPGESGESGESGGGARAGGRRRVTIWLLAAALLSVLGGMRTWELDLDPPEVVVPGYRGQAHFRDEAAKAHEARNQAKFGDWRLSPADEYGFWRIQSPAWVYGECLWFKGLGVGLVQARAFVVVHGLIALALLFWLALVRHGPVAAFAVTGLLGFNWAYLVYSRLALMEGAILAWLILATVGLSQMDRRPERAPLWSALAVVGILVACLIKQTGLLLVPAFCLAMPYLGLRAARAASDDPRASLGALLRRPQLWSALLGVVVVAVVLALFLLNPEYQERLAFNAEHFTGAKKQEHTVLGRASELLARGLFSSRIRLMFFLFAPVMLWLATLEFTRTLGWGVRGLRARRRRARGQEPAEERGREGEEGEEGEKGEGLDGAPGAMDLWMLAWLLLGLAANLASPHRAIRFQLVMLPPAAWLAGALVARAWAHTWPHAFWRGLVRGGLVSVALMGVGTTAARFGLWLSEGQPTAAEMGEQLEELIGDRHAVVVGEFAAQAVFETDYWHFYVRPGQFNTSSEVIHVLGITHLVLDEKDFVERQLRRSTPELLRGRRELGKIDYRGRELVVWELLGEAEREAKRETRAQELQARKAESEQRAKDRELRRRQAQKNASLPKAPSVSPPRVFKPGKRSAPKPTSAGPE